MAVPLNKAGDRMIFVPGEGTLGWTVERKRSLSFKYMGEPPLNFRGLHVIVLDYSLDESSYRVHFVGDDPSDYFFCCDFFLEKIASCYCSSSDLFNFGCRCGNP